MVCPRCQAENRDGVKFCEECGALLAGACPACGAETVAGRKFCGACGAPLPGGPPARFASPRAYTPAHLAEKILTSRAALEGERKQVTVLFADVSGFTAISERLDPEDIHRLMDGAFERMLGEVHRYEGTVNQFLGDGLMALFGAPITHEDHAQRAVHAALGIQRALRGYGDELQRTGGITFGMRIGINTGLVVVGAIGDNLRMDYTAMGDTTNLAARMQQHASPGQVVIAEPTHRLVRGFFECRALGTVQVKNRQEPVAAYAVEGALEGATRLGARAAAGLSPFVGRAQELALLERAWGQALEGRGQIVFLVGEAGMGKSRLLLEFRRTVPEDAAIWLEGRCLSFGTPVAHLPIADMLRRHLGIEERDGQARMREKVDRGLQALGPEAGGAAPYLRFLLSLDPGDPAVAGMDPQQRRMRIFEALRLLTVRLSQRRPLIQVVEDLHWIDPATEEYLKFVGESLAGAAVLLVLTYRPGYQHPLGDRTYHTRIALQALSAQESLGVARGMLGAAELPAEVGTALTRKAEGNPFFLEELLRSLQETGALRREDGGFVLARPAADLGVPDTVQDVIMARIDRLPGEPKRTLQVASVLGREFSARPLGEAMEAAEGLEASLRNLLRLEFVVRKANGADATYVFKHALTQEVAYASILRAQRRQLHARIGSVLEQLYAERRDERLEELAHHFLHGEVWDKAVHYLRLAGAKAVAECVDREAVAFYERALEALARLPGAPERVGQSIDLRLELRAPLWRLGMLDRLFDLFREAEELARSLGDPRRLDKIYAFLAQYYWARGQHRRAIEYGERCLSAAEGLDDLGLRVTGNLYLGHAHHGLGEYARAAECLGQNVELLEGDRATERFGLSGLPYVVSCAWAVDALAELGEFDRGLGFAQRGTRVAEAADHPYSLAAVRTAEGYLRARRGEPEAAIAILEPALETCRSKNFVGWTILSSAALGIAYAYAGRFAEAIALHQEAIRIHEGAGALVNRGLFWAGLAEAYLLAGQAEGARRAAEEALKFATEHEERGREALAKWLLGAAIACAKMLEDAARLAEGLGLRPTLARALTTLGELHAKAGDRAEAMARLARACDLFRAMGMARELARAEALLQGSR